MARQFTRRTILGKCFSEGARLLWLALEKRGLDQSAAEEKLGTSSGLVNRWLYGERRPGLEHALRIEKMLSIPASAWHQAPKKAFEPPALARTGTDNE